MSRAMLPPQSTELERAVADLIAQHLTPLPVNYADLWDPDTCPLNLLPHLAWAYSVDMWDDEWSEQEQRAAVRQAIFIHRHKGTVGAARAALDALGIGLSITEWWEDGAAPGSGPHTFRVDAYADNVFDAGMNINPKLLAMITAQIEHVKPVRSHFSLRVGERFLAHVSVQSALRDKRIDRATPDFSPAYDAFETGVSPRSAMRERMRDRQTLDFMEAA